MTSTIGDRIRDLRDRRGFRQQELADKISVSRQVLSNWERGYTPVDADGIAKLAIILEVSTDYLLHGRITDDSISPKKQIALALEDDEELLVFFNDLSKREELKLLFNQVKPLKKETIKRIIKYIKIVEDEESLND